MSNLLQITPFLHVPDLAKAIDLFTRVLRFEVKYRVADYAYLEWGPAAIRVLENRETEIHPAEEVRYGVYIDVRDADALYAELLPELSTLPPGDVREPANKVWNQRELLVRLPDGQWLVFGQSVAR